MTGNWSLWAYLWPLEVISVAAGFILMAIFLKVPWLMIPASIIGLTGLVLQFCAFYRSVEWLGSALDGGTVRRRPAAAADRHFKKLKA